MAANKSWKRKVAGNFFFISISITFRICTHSRFLRCYQDGSLLLDVCGAKYPKGFTKGLNFWVVPFANYVLWKHKVAKAATLWV
jgi:hypothetical protein